MKHYFDHIKISMLEVLKSDSTIGKNAFSTSFTESDFVYFVLGNILLLLVQKKTSCATLIEIINRVVYR